MRKFLWVVAVGGLVLFMAAPAMALDFRFGAEYRVRFYDYANTGFDSANSLSVNGANEQPGSNNSRGNPRGIQNRIRPRFDASDDNGNIQATIRFETGDTTWGAGGGANSSSMGSNYPYTIADPNGNRTGNNAGGSIGTDGVSLEVKWGFLDFALPFGVPLRVRAGLQAFYLPKGLVIDDDAAGLRLYGNKGILNYEASWWRISTAPASSSAAAGTTGQARFDSTKDDNFDMYLFKVGLNLARELNAGVWYMYGDNRANCDNPNNLGAQATGTEYITTLCPGQNRIRPQNWFGLDFLGTVGTVDYDLDFVYGEAKGGAIGSFTSGTVMGYTSGGTLANPTGQPIDVRGFAIDGGLHIPIGPMKLNLLGTYASGDSQKGVGTKSGAFPIGPGPSWSGAGGQYELIGEGGAFDVVNATQHGPTGLWMLGATLEYVPVKPLWLKLAYGYIGFSNKNANCANDFTVVAGVLTQIAGTQCYGPVYYGQPSNPIAGKSTLGQEIDLRADYTMWTGFKVQAMAGWLVPSAGDTMGKYILQFLYNF